MQAKKDEGGGTLKNNLSNPVKVDTSLLLQCGPDQFRISPGSLSEMKNLRLRPRKAESKSAFSQDALWIPELVKVA